MIDRWKELERIVSERVLTPEEVDEVLAMGREIEPTKERTSLQSFWTAMVRTPNRTIIADNVKLCKGEILSELIRSSRPFIDEEAQQKLAQIEQQTQADRRGRPRGGARSSDGPGRKR